MTAPRKTALVAIASCILAASPAPAALPFDTSKIEQITGLTGTQSTAEHVFKVTAPRNDISITVDGWKVPPLMVPTSWASFMPGGKADAMLMGSIVLLADEVNEALDAALAGGLEVAALRSDFLSEDSKIFSMHIGGEGTAESLATGVRGIFNAISAARKARPAPPAAAGFAGLPATNSITPAPLEKILGKGHSQDGVYKVVIGREATMPCGCRIGRDMGINTWVAFAGSDENAVVDGDFAVTEEELQPVLKSLRGSAINVAGIHHHMTGETPRYLFVHFWGRGPAADLAAAVKRVLSLE